MKIPHWTHWPRRLDERFVEGPLCQRSGSFARVPPPERSADHIAEGKSVRVFDAFFDDQDLVRLEYEGATPEATCRPEHHPATLPRTYSYGSPSLVRSCRRLKRQTQHHEQPMGWTRQMALDLKAIAGFRLDNDVVKPNHKAQVESLNSRFRDELRLKSASLSRSPTLRDAFCAAASKTLERDTKSVYIKPVGCQHIGLA